MNNQDWASDSVDKNILTFVGFANFYWQFITNFNKIVILFTLILKTKLLAFSLNNSINMAIFLMAIRCLR